MSVLARVVSRRAALGRRGAGDRRRRRRSRVRARRARRGGARGRVRRCATRLRAGGHVLAQGLSPAHQPLPKPLRLLLVPPLAGRRGRVDDDAGRDRGAARARPGARVRRGALLPRRQAREGLLGLPPHARLPRARRAPSSTCTGPGRWRSPRAPAAHQRGAPDRRGHDAAQGGERQPRADARVREPAPLRAGDAAPSRAGQAARQAPGDDRRGRPAAHPLHDGHPRRHRRDPARAGREPAGDPRRAPQARARAGGHRAELPRRPRRADGAGRPNPATTR